MSKQRSLREVVARAAFAHRWPGVFPSVENGERPVPNEMLLEADAILEALAQRGALIV